jgi:cytochrome c-type biogenesis protein
VNIELFAERILTGAAAGPAAFGIAFLGGVLAGFGPCILPLIPAVFGYITGSVGRGESEGVKTAAPVRGLLLSTVFVIGMSLVFSAIGAAAGLLGRALIFGAWAYYAAAAVCVVIALQMLEVIHLPVDRLNALLPMQRPERRGLLGALLFGMLFGLVASPCSTPILAAIATLAAASASAITGAALLFVFGVGKGVPLLLLGVASGSLGFMRRVSNVVPALTTIGGVGLLVAAAYLVWIA